MSYIESTPLDMGRNPALAQCAMGMLDDLNRSSASQGMMMVKKKRVVDGGRRWGGRRLCMVCGVVWWRMDRRRHKGASEQGETVSLLCREGCVGATGSKPSGRNTSAMAWYPQ